MLDDAGSVEGVIGGSDASAEGTWEWANGPEAGQVFWTGGQGGAAANGLYANFLAGEPNNSGDQDYLSFDCAFALQRCLGRYKK